jgi:N-acetylglucosaminyl-diphospho-decaprenol L-rhamnosyltransferase
MVGIESARAWTVSAGGLSNAGGGNVLDLTIALVNWNNRDYLKQCLESIEAAQLPLAYEIVVADNGSTDGSQRMLAQRFPYVKLVQNEGNVGVARGNNQCIEHSTGRHIYILNNDTLVNSDSILAMVRFLEEHPTAGAVGGNLLNPDGSLQVSFCRFPTLWEEFLLVTHLGKRLNPYFPGHNGVWPYVRAVDWISSASILVRRSAIEGIGLIDEEYFIYSDETDWQYRLWKAGWEVYYLPEVTTVHFGGGSFRPGDRRFTLVYRGRMLFARKHYGWLYSTMQRAMFALAALGRQAVWLALRALPGWRSAARLQLRANRETLRLCVRLE